MQFADLMKLFREGQNEGRKRGYVTQGACDAEGIRRVVEALRDEIVYAPAFAEDILDKILASDGVKGTHGSPELDEDARKLEAMGQDAGPTVQDLFPEVFAPAAAPVCEWTPQDEGPAHEIWKTGCGTRYERNHSPGWCGRCGKPIKFKSEAAR